MGKLINSIDEIFSNYDYFLIDLWGVIHDGTKIYPYAKEALTKLKKENKKILFLSNSPRRKFVSENFLKTIDINNDLYNHILTSGELVYHNISNFISGKTYFHIGPVENADLLDGLDYKKTNDFRSAEFILVTGLFDFEKGLDKEFELVKEAKKLNIPMLCANPDIIVVTQNNEKFLCAGAVAKEYENIGGQVRYIGKPYIEIYDKALEILKTTKDRVIAIGDSLNTDINGANNFNIDNIFVSNGIHKNEIDSSIDNIFQKYSQNPKYYITHFR